MTPASHLNYCAPPLVSHSPFSFFEMQANSNYTKYIILIGVSVLILCVYQIKYNTFALRNNIASADYLIQDASQQHHFNNASLNAALALSDDDRNETCSCSSKTTNTMIVNHGENAPVFVPDTMPIEPDIVDKLHLNKYADDTVMVTIAGYALVAEVYNWMKLLEYADESNYVIFCTDDKLYMHLVIAGYEDQAVLIPDNWFMNDLDLFRNTTHSLLDRPSRLSHVKTWVLQRLIYQPYHIMMLDVNQVVLHKRTIEYIQTLMHLRGDTKLLASQDSLDQRTVNTGLMLLRSNSQQLKRVLAQTVLLQEENPDLTQQELFNMALDKTNLHVKTGMVVLLDILHFPNGHYHFNENLPGSKGIEPFVVHLNHKVRHIHRPFQH